MPRPVTSLSYVILLPVAGIGRVATTLLVSLVVMWNRPCPPRVRRQTIAPCRIVVASCQQLSQNDVGIQGVPGQVRGCVHQIKIRQTTKNRYIVIPRAREARQPK